MKTIWLALFCVVVSTTAQAQELQAFSFRQLQSELTYDAAKKAALLKEGCEYQSSAPAGIARSIRFCMTEPGAFGSGVGAIPLTRSEIAFDQAGFIGYTFNVSESDHVNLRDLLVQKYGQPCGRREAEVKVFGEGGTVKQQLTDWCFKDGLLTLTDRWNVDPSQTSAHYAAYRWTKNEPIPIKVDF